MKLPNTAHTSPPWRIHEIAGDFGIQDVWELPTPGGPHDLDRLVRLVAGQIGRRQSGAVVRTLMALRWKIGGIMGWDRPEFAVGAGTRSLRERLPADLREAPRPDLRDGLFTSVYQTHEEWAGEYADQLVHAILHLGWVRDGSAGGYRAQMAVLVRPAGWVGKVYMAGIRPFRWFLVYPSMLRSLGRAWQAQGNAET